MKRSILFLLVLVSIVFLSACTQNPIQGATIQKNTPTAQDVNNNGIKEFKLDAPHAGYVFYDKNKKILPFGIAVNKGDRVRFLATSDLLNHNHGVTIDEYGINEVILTEDQNNPKVIEFTADKAGIFKIWCKTCLTGAFGPHSWIEATLEVK